MAEIPEGGECDLTIKQGAGFRETFSSRDDDEVTVIPFPDGTTGRAQVREATTRALRLTFTVDVDAAAGDVTISATDDQTAAMRAGGRWDLFLDPPGADAIFFVGGNVELEPRMTP